MPKAMPLAKPTMQARTLIRLIMMKAPRDMDVIFNFRFCPAFAGHAHAWIGDVITHAKDAKDAKRIWLIEMG